ncbi:MAG: alpha/beta hydrolase, partial [Bdellovibrionales bacterium]|nr:alpha/beta hydrolase [Bdellovibrionales bacterium]
MNYLLLRGLGRTQGHWGVFSQKLKDLGEVYSIDLPGFGEESQASVPLTIDEHVEFLRRKWREREAAEGNVVLIGLSLGGMVALKWLEKYPKDFHAGVIINSSSANGMNHFRRLRPKGAYGLARVALAKSDYEKELFSLELTSFNNKNNLSVLTEWLDLRERYPLNHKSVVRQLVAAGLFRRPKKIDVPLLFLASKQDKLVNYRNTRDLAKALKGEFHLC